MVEERKILFEVIVGEEAKSDDFGLGHVDCFQDIALLVCFFGAADEVVSEVELHLL